MKTHRRAHATGPAAGGSGSGADLLARTAPFDRYPRRALRPLEPSVDHLQLRAGTVLARQDEPVREFVLVIEGSVVAVDADGNTRSLGPGSTIGGDELAAGLPHHETLVAGAGTDVVVVNGPAYRWAVAELFTR